MIIADETLWVKIEPEPMSGCWLWTGNRNDAGYGIVVVRGRRTRVHRIMYELARGAIPAGLQLDHLCRTPACVNPQHLEAVTHYENWRRGKAALSSRWTHCRRGHEYTPANTKIRGGTRTCKECAAIRARQRFHEKHPEAGWATKTYRIRRRLEHVS